MMENHTELAAPMRITTNECVQLNELSKLNGWDTDYRQIGAGKFSTSFNLYASTGIRFSEQYCNREMIVSAAPPPEHAALFLPLNPGDKGTLQGQSLGVGNVALIAPESEVFYRSPKGLHMMVVTIPVSRLEGAIKAASDDKHGQLTAGTRVLTLADDAISRLSNCINSALEIAEAHTDQAEFNVCLQEMEQDVATILSLALTNPEQPEHGARGRKNRLGCLKRATDFIEANLASPLGLETLSQAAGASPRTLEIAFREVFNITMVQYIKNRRLTAINRLLLDPQYHVASVSSLSRAHGFKQMGHFARDYRSLFGESPSDTLRMQRG